MVAATVYSDGAGNKYLGDCIWHNPDITFPLDYFLDTFYFSVGSMESPPAIYDYDLSMKALFNALGLTETTDYDVLGTWGNPAPDTGISVGLPGLTALTAGFRAEMGEVNGTRLSEVALVGSGGNGAFHDLSSSFQYLDNNLIDYTGFYDHAGIVVSASNNHLAWLNYTYNKQSNTYAHRFLYAGKMANVNTNFAYYSEDVTTQTCVAANEVEPGSATTSFNPLSIKHKIGGVVKAPMQNGVSNYSFVCSDAQTPTTDWATDFYLFDNNVDLGTPCMGKLPGLLIGQGTYELFKPVKITSAATADSGSPWFLPVASYHTDKTVLMRVHSSMV